MSERPAISPPGRLVLRDSRRGLLVLLALNLALLGLFALFVAAWPRAFGRALALLAGLGVAGHAALLLCRIVMASPPLILDAEGILDLRRSPRRIAWSEVRRARLGAPTSVALWLEDPEPYWASMPLPGRWLARLPLHAVFGHVHLARVLDRRAAREMTDLVIAALPGRVSVNDNRTLRDDWPEIRREGE